MRVVPTNTTVDTLNNKQQQLNMNNDNSSKDNLNDTTTSTIDGSFRQSTLGTIHKKKPLPKIPLNKSSMSGISEDKRGSSVVIPPPPVPSINTSGYVSVGPAWTTTNTGGQFILNNEFNNAAAERGNQEIYLSESPSAIMSNNPIAEQQSNIENNNNRFSSYTYDMMDNNNHNLLLTQAHMDYYNNDPYYHHHGYPVYNTQQNYGYYNQPYNYVPDITNEMSTVSISTNGGWKTSSGNGSKNMITRSDSLKIETAVPVPFSKAGYLPLETHLEKPFEPTSADDQPIQRKASKEEIYISFEAPTSVLLQKLNQSVRHRNAGPITILSPLLYDNSGTETNSSSSSNLSTPQSSVSSFSYQPQQQQRPTDIQRHSMPLISTVDQQQEELEDTSFSAAEKYFQQPNNVSPVSSRIPSPWGTSRSATVIRQSISRISTGSIPNIAVQTVQVPDEISLVSSKSASESKAEQYFGIHSNSGTLRKKDIDVDDARKKNGKYSLSIASCSLINIRSNTKLYRRMAIKTHNKETQMTYARYLLQISKLYEKNNHTVTNTMPTASSSSVTVPIVNNKKNVQQESPAETRHRLLSEAGYWIERLAKARNPEALFIKGRWHLLGPQAEDCVIHGYEKVHEAKAFKCFLSASKAGWVDAHYELAHLWKKRGNYAKAIQCYEKGAKEKHTLSIYKIAKILLRGQLKKQKDIPKGMAFLKQAADMSDPASAEPAFVLGCIYANEFDRIGIQRNVSTAIDDSPGKVNYSLALKYLKKSAHHGYPDAIYFMGQISETGMLGQLCDSWQAYQHYMKAAEVNHAGAMLDLSRIYSQGISGLLAAQKDMAFKWCKRSADLGFDQAEYVLGKYYEDGIGVTPDFPLALEYFGKAASKGYQPAAEKLNRPLADGTRRRLKKNIMDHNEKYLTVVVSEPKVKQDDDDDDDQDNTLNNNQKNYTRNSSRQNNNNVCTIQ